MDFEKWARGFRLDQSDGTFQWKQSEKPDSNYFSFLDFANVIFAYSNYEVLLPLLEEVPVETLQAGDVFLSQEGRGYAAMVGQVVQDCKPNGQKRF